MTIWLKTLSAKILIGTSLAVMLATVIASIYSGSMQKAALEKAFDKQNQTVASTIAVFSIEPLLTMDYPVLEHALTVAGKKNDTILYIEVIHRGVAIATYGQATQNGRKFSNEIRIHDGVSGKLGEVHVVFSTRDHDALIAERRRESAIASLMIFAAFGVALLWLLRRTVIGPIQHLTRQTEQTIEHALPELASSRDAMPNNPDEIKQLGERFVTMLNGLKRRDAAREAAEAALLEHKNNLENLVEIRTRALRDAQQEAIRLNKNKSDFLAAASHDLRQPIQALSLFQGALARSGLSEEQARLNYNIGTSLTSLGEILNTLLDISKLDSGVVTANPCALPADELFSLIDDAFGAVATQKGLRFKLWLPFNDITLYTDPNLLFSLLRNLIDNAIKYTPSGGVLVSVRPRGKQALIQVWDTGIGISPEDRQRIFDEYVQISNPERDKTKGLGLGLSIVKRITTLLDSEVTCRSQPGKGSVFQLYVPMLENEQPTPTVPRQESKKDDGRTFNFTGRTIVIVEDDTLVAEAIGLSLEAQGMKVWRFTNGEDAFAFMTRFEPDFLISDYWLPGAINGIELIRKLQALRGHPTRAVLITGDSTARLPAELKASGYRILYKPIELQQFLSTLAALYAAPQVAP